MKTVILSFESRWHIFLACTEQLYLSSLPAGNVAVVDTTLLFISMIGLSEVSNMFSVGQQVIKYVFTVHRV